MGHCDYGCWEMHSTSGSAGFSLDVSKSARVDTITFVLCVYMCVGF